MSARSASLEGAEDRSELAIVKRCDTEACAVCESVDVKLWEARCTPVDDVDDDGIVAR